MVYAPLNINVFATPESVTRQPTKRPPFTKESILKQLPARLFVKSTFWSMVYLLRDLAMIAALGFGATRIESAPAAWRSLLWVVYWYAQGCVMTGVWVLSHECGHQAFSPSKTVNGKRASLHDSFGSPRVVSTLRPPPSTPPFLQIRLAGFFTARCSCRTTRGA